MIIVVTEVTSDIYILNHHHDTISEASDWSEIHSTAWQPPQAVAPQFSAFPIYFIHIIF